MTAGLGITVFSEEVNKIEYKNFQMKVDTHEVKLANSEKAVPIYTELKYSFNKDRRISPFIKGDFGFNYVDEAEEAGRMRDMAANNYSSMGVGVDVGYLSMEAAYMNYQIAAEEKENEFSEDRIMLRLKYKY